MIKIHQILNNQRGSILVESLVSLLIVVPAIIALMSLYTTAIKGSTINQNYNNAVYIAQKYLEDLKQYDGSTGIKALTKDKTRPSPVTFDNVAYTVNIDSFTPADNSLDAHIYPYRATVSWTDTTVNPAATRSIQVAAYYYSKINQ